MLAFNAHLQKFFKLPTSYKSFAYPGCDFSNKLFDTGPRFPSIYGVFGKPDQVMMDGL